MPSDCQVFRNLGKPLNTLERKAVGVCKSLREINSTLSRFPPESQRISSCCTVAGEPLEGISTG